MPDTLPTLTYADIEAAARRLHGVAHQTPVLTSRQFNKRNHLEAFFKCENFQRIGAFKFRGAYNALACLKEAQIGSEVVTFSSGNHAQAVALAAKLLGVRATIVMPEDAPAAKLAATRGYDAEVILYKKGVEDREVIASRWIQERGATLIPPYDHLDVIAGQGTVAKELIEDVGALDFLFVCVGGGGLISGCAVAVTQLLKNCQVIGVEPEAGNDAQQSLRAGRIVSIPVPETIADGAQTQHLGKVTFPIIQKYVTDIVAVSDDQLCYQMRFFAERMKMIVEPTGCLAAAGVTNSLNDLAGSRVGVIISGGNVDMAQFSRCVSAVEEL